jgi:hypothetical protein
MVVLQVTDNLLKDLISNLLAKIKDKGLHNLEVKGQDHTRRHPTHHNQTVSLQAMQDHMAPVQANLKVIQDKGLPNLAVKDQDHTKKPPTHLNQMDNRQAMQDHTAQVQDNLKDLIPVDNLNHLVLVTVPALLNQDLKMEIMVQELPKNQATDPLLPVNLSLILQVDQANPMVNHQAKDLGHHLNNKGQAHHKNHMDLQANPNPTLPHHTDQAVAKQEDNLQVKAPPILAQANQIRDQVTQVPVHLQVAKIVHHPVHPLQLPLLQQLLTLLRPPQLQLVKLELLLLLQHQRNL